MQFQLALDALWGELEVKNQHSVLYKLPGAFWAVVVIAFTLKSSVVKVNLILAS